ncbi:MAG: hypothetical protein KG075_09380 [Alphaproteobacteria bacterium]|nr:hypothetical protein [Alphaproteobacteria bacterium]
MTGLSIGPTTPALAAAAVDTALAREQWQASIIREIQARGAPATDAQALYDLRLIDFDRCRRNNMTPAQAVTNVIGSWADRG